MLFNGNVTFKGAALFEWAQHKEDGSIELVFERDHCESTVMFDQGAWGVVKEAVGKLETGEGDLTKNGLTVFNPLRDTHGKGSIEVNGVIINTHDQPLAFDFDESQGLDLARQLPTIIIRTAGKKGSGDIELTLSPKAARELRDRLDKALDAHSAVRRLAQSKSVPVLAR